MNNIEQGLTLMVMGLSITFSALALFIGVIVLLKRFFPAEQKPNSAGQKVARQQTIGPLARDTTEEEVAVAITLALAHLYAYELCRSNLGSSLEKGAGPWWRAGQWERLSLDAIEIRERN